MQKAEKRFQAIFQKAITSGLTANDYAKLDVVKEFSLKTTIFAKLINKVTISLFIVILLLSLLSTQTNVFNDSQCLIDMPSDASKWFREPENCDMCENVFEVAKISNLSSLEFYSNFVSKARPLVVTDGAKAWPAATSFSFDFFKKLYSDSEFDDETCQFFPYKTEFTSLREALEMDPKRALLESGAPWYIGWSNCNDEAGKILRDYYQVPYFLPNTSENIALNWIFMGGPGPGAHMHVDNVQYPSWQAQIKGRKTWHLAPPPECYYKCEQMQVTVEPGEINTNRWYHQTFVLPGDISITIGTEFD